MNYVTHLPNGRILQSGSCQPECLQFHDRDGAIAIEVTDLVDPNGFYVSDGALVPMPSKPSENHKFNYTSKQWEDPRTLDDLKAEKWRNIKANRDSHEQGGFTWDGSVFDSDAISQQRITGAVTLAQLSTEFTMAWTLADNSVRVLSQLEMLDVGVTLGFHVATQFVRGQTLRAQIEAAVTKEEVEAIVW